MAVIRKRSSGAWEVIIRRKNILPRPHYATLNSEAEASAYARKLEAILDSGIVPPELQESNEPDVTVAAWLERYQTGHSPSAQDRGVIPIINKDIGTIPLKRLSRDSLHAWIGALKKERQLTPGSIRKRVGCLARALDVAVHLDIISINPARQLPRNYAAYAESDGPRRVDVERDRRLATDEEERIRLVLARDVEYVKSVGRERPIDGEHIEAWRLLFDLALETAMRLSEMYTLTVSQVDIEKRTIFLDRTKNGDKRQVPLSSIAIALLTPYIEGKERTALLFPWWTGDPRDRRKTTGALSAKWQRIASLAQCGDLKFHDLRHEATCRFYERTTLSDVQIARITGHRDLRMLKRYASLRGSDLANWLW